MKYVLIALLASALMCQAQSYSVDGHWSTIGILSNFVTSLPNTITISGSTNPVIDGVYTNGPFVSPSNSWYRSGLVDSVQYHIRWIDPNNKFYIRGTAGSTANWTNSTLYNPLGIYYPILKATGTITAVTEDYYITTNTRPGSISTNHNFRFYSIDGTRTIEYR